MDARGAERWRQAAQAMGLAGIVLLFLLPYVRLFPFVGSFPAEDVTESLPGAAFTRTMCLTDLAVRNARSASPPPELRVERGAIPVAVPLLERSDSLYFSEGRSGIIALDRIENADAQMLKTFATRGSVSREHLASFLEDVDRQYAPCRVPRGDVGVTEGYWASKGTSVLHHWVHLYSGILSWSESAQYGYAIPWSVRELLKWTSSLGPTRFVQLSWFVFAACGLAYIAIFVHLFHEHPRLAATALAVKLFFFTRIGSFALVLAPGFHWYRELVLLAVPAILNSSAARQSAVGWRRARPSLARAATLLALCYLVEPTFFMVAATCAMLAALWEHHRAAVDALRSHKRVVLVVLVILSSAAVAVVGHQISNLSYVAAKLRGDDVVVPAAKYVMRITIVCLGALAYLLVQPGRRQKALDGYFALVTLFASVYYFVTPDDFHFYKFAEYSVPFGLVLAATIFDRLEESIAVRLSEAWLHGATAIVFVVLAAMSVDHLASTPRSRERRLEDSHGAPYFQAASYTINDRLIRADMSERLAEHLRAFPAAARFDIMVSPFDKYVTFLYDRGNGLGTPDLVAWLDAPLRLDRARQSTVESPRPVRVLLDEATLDVDPRLGIRRDDAALGWLHLASKLHIKNRLRAAELGAELMARCAVDGPGGNKGWLLLRCGGEG